MHFRLYSECECFHLDANKMACLRVIFEYKMCKDDAATNSKHLQASEDQNKEVINNSTMISCGPMISVLPYTWRLAFYKKFIFRAIL